MRSADELRLRLARLRREFDYVLIDAPACDAGVDAVLLGQLSEAAILVVEADATRRVSAGRAKQDFDAAGIALAGTVLHNRSFVIPKSLYEKL
jgi:receptor protein-tyrosine kinase